MGRMDVQALQNGGPMEPPPFITPELPGIGGAIKLAPEHFIVREIPLYLPSGTGKHLYLNLTRSGMNTRQVVDILAEVFGVDQGGIGLAGLKDKQATATQRFSLPGEGLDPEEAARALQGSGLTLNQAAWHTNKLKRGHLLGNHFTIVVAGPEPGALERAQAIAATLARRGLPNFFGSQRFGASGDNAMQGRRILAGRGSPRGWRAQLMLSAYQSLLFNAWLAERLARGWFRRMLAGDQAKKYDTGGMFLVTDEHAETARLAAGEITHTGPIFGSKTRPALGEPGRLEAEVLAASGVSADDFRRCRLKGSRRPGRLLVDEVEITEHPQGLQFSFALPKGAYATVLMREFMKTEPHLPE